MSLIFQYIQLASESVYWLAPSVVATYVLFVILKVIGLRVLSPLSAAVIYTLLAFATFPTIPKYKFENDVKAEFTNAAEFQLINSSSAFSIAEPLAFFAAPTTFFHFVAPMGPPAAEPYSFGSSTNSFQEFFYEYGKEPKIRMIDADCETFNIGIAEPVDGAMRYVDEREMLPKEKGNYCSIDYTRESNIVDCKLKVLLSQSSDELDEQQLEALFIRADSQCKRD